MGRSLYEQVPVFRSWMNRLDGIVREQANYSVLSELYFAERKKSDVFDAIRLTHPAIFMVEYAAAQVLIESGVIPDEVLGASLGTFAAATIAGCFTVHDALLAVLAQAELLEKHAPKGAMFAVLGDPSAFQSFAAALGFEIAAFNFSDHFVISCSLDRTDDISRFFHKQNVIIQRLNVNFAFHSAYIQSLEARLVGNISGLLGTAAHASMPIWCCATANIASDMGAGYFWKVARNPIYFERTVMEAERTGPNQYIDLGPSGTLATFTRYLLSATNSTSFVRAVMSPYGGDLKNLAVLIS